MQNKSKTIDQILDQHKSPLDKDFTKYRNHVYRVFMLCQLLDNKKENIEKYAIASAFHDLGIWSDNTFDYLKPSILQAKKYLIDNNQEEWVDEISLMIDMHHKRSKYTGQFTTTVESFRRADWIDVTKGQLTFKVSKAEIKKTVEEYPVAGFHGFLVKQTLKNFLKSPLNPLPMFKK